MYTGIYLCVSAANLAFGYIALYNMYTQVLHMQLQLTHVLYMCKHASHVQFKLCILQYSSQSIPH